jgi:hypothetical protein
MGELKKSQRFRETSIFVDLAPDRVGIKQQTQIRLRSRFSTLGNCERRRSTDSGKHEVTTIHGAPLSGIN